MIHLILLICGINLSQCDNLWNIKINQCPKSCTCQLQHLTETAIYRFMQDKNVKPSHEVNSAENNEVLYEEDNLTSEFLEEKQIIRSAICLIDTKIEDLCDNLPNDLEALTLIEGYHVGSKTIQFSLFKKFKNLISVEIIGSKLPNELSSGPLISEVDVPLPHLKFMNLENVLVRSSRIQIQNFVKMSKTEPTFQYIQKSEGAHSLLIQSQNSDEILPYNIYKTQDSPDKIPLFFGFDNLFLLRIVNCRLSNLHWTMFDSLNHLQYLILDKNNLKFIPPFAFNGCPNLKTLSLAHNNLLDIQLTDLAGLLELEFLDLSYNNFSQLSELSLPPFPKLKLANFGNNPINIIFPNTFQVLNTTDSLIIGSNEVNLLLMTNSFIGLDLLKTLTLNNLNIKILTRDLLTGLPSLNELILNGNITEIEFDSFISVKKLIKLILAHCHLHIISMDAFIGLEQLEILDLSNNNLEQLPSKVFDQLPNIKEIYLQNNQLSKLPHDIFSKISARLLRLNQNSWDCSCEMGEWKPIIINRVKQNVVENCARELDKGLKCQDQKKFLTHKYVYSNKVAPKCATPKEYENWSVFHFMKKILKCIEFRPKLKRKFKKIITTEKPKINQTNIDNNLYDVKSVEYKKYLKQKIQKIRKNKYENDELAYQNNEI